MFMKYFLIICSTFYRPKLSFTNTFAVASFSSKHFTQGTKHSQVHNKRGGQIKRGSFKDFEKNYKRGVKNGWEQNIKEDYL